MHLIKVFFLFLVILSNSCSMGDGSKFQPKPKALGKMNEIVVIVDTDLWNNMIGDTIRYFFGGYYPITPRPEPLFDLRFMTPEDLRQEPLKKQLRTYMLVCNMTDDRSPVTQMVKTDLGTEGLRRSQEDPDFSTSIGKDKWAYGQILIYVFANGQNKLAEVIEKNFEGISARVNAHDRVQLYQYSFPSGENLGLSARLSKQYQAQIKIPIEFKIATEALEENKLVWLRKDTKSGYANLVFRQYDYVSEDQLSKESSKKRFNLFGRKYVSTPEPNTYLVVNDTDLPILEFSREISGRFTKEYRGIWEIENDFFGGPFMTYVIVNPDSAKFLQIDAFIFDPGKKKRNLMQQLDLIVKEIKF